MQNNTIISGYANYVDFVTIKVCKVHGKKHKFDEQTTEPASETSFFIKGKCACGKVKILDLVSKF